MPTSSDFLAFYMCIVVKLHGSVDYQQNVKFRSEEEEF
jgi:hypothetical protein